MSTVKRIERSEAEALTECVCEGTGSVAWEASDARSYTLGTSLCPCRRSEEPIEGKAAWWVQEVAFTSGVTLSPSIGDLTVKISVSPEVPVSADNRRVLRFGNRYWPTLVDVSVGEESWTLFAEAARDLARQLNAAADVAEKIDRPDTDVCGHWAPCRCVTESAS